MADRRRTMDEDSTYNVRYVLFFFIVDGLHDQDDRLEFRHLLKPLELVGVDLVDPGLELIFTLDGQVTDGDHEVVRMSDHGLPERDDLG